MRQQKLQVLICTHGEDGLNRIAKHSHPQHEDTEYLVSWQQSGSGSIPFELKDRKDFKIVREDSIGLCNNRNNALKHASARYVLVSDDDVSYQREYFDRILEAFGKNHNADFLIFRYRSDDYPKEYPEKEFDMKAPPKGYYVSSIEIALDIEKISLKGLDVKTLFNPAFGLNGTHFCSGEEDILIADLKRQGLKGKYVPEIIANHEGTTTSDRIKNTPEEIRVKGAVILHLHPHSWPLRMLVHAFRSRRERSPFNYCRFWLSGVRTYRELMGRTSH